MGDPLLEGTLYGPLHTAAAVEEYRKTIADAVKAGGTIEFGGNVSDNTVIHIRNYCSTR